MRGGRWGDRVDGTDVHCGYVAGRYRDGAWSDGWTDVDRCAEGTFTAYAAACTCGWRGRPRPASRGGRQAVLHAWEVEHRPVAVSVPMPAAGGSFASPR
jgi:hypothetical protein